MLALIGFMGLCLLVLVAHGAVAAAAGLPGWEPPPGTPPGWAYGPAWLALYPLTGLAAWMVWRRIDVGAARKRAALRMWGWQVLASALWPAAFFGAHDLPLAFVIMAALLAAVALTAWAFLRLHPPAGLLLLPYGAWLLCLAYVNTGFWWLNP